jgi:hypothetical protein
MTKDPSKHRYSTRSQVLKRVLDCIKADKFEDYGELMIFGNQLPASDHVDREALREFLSDLRRYKGLTDSENCASLDGDPTMPTPRGIDRFPKGFRMRLIESLNDNVDTQRQPEPETSHARADALDALDARYASVVAGKLEKFVSRAARLDRIEIREIPSKSARDYFREAHNCYL